MTLNFDFVFSKNVQSKNVFFEVFFPLNFIKGELRHHKIFNFIIMTNYDIFSIIMTILIILKLDYHESYYDYIDK